MTFEELKKEFLDIKKKGQTDGVTLEDYNKLLEINRNLYMLAGENLDFSTQELLVSINDVIEEMYCAGLLNKFSYNDCYYISRNSFLLPLVLANNEYSHIKMYSDNSYQFLCQMHKEENPSLGVTDLKNVMSCFGCWFNGNAISYLKAYEHLSYRKSLALLAQIYKIDVPVKYGELDELVKKYQAAILSDEYVKLMERGQWRLKKRGIERYNGMDVNTEYQKRYDAIERIRNNEYDSNFIYEGPKQLIYLNGDKRN